MNRSSRNNEHGNVLFYILIAVILLAALSYAVSQSSRGNLGAVSDERAKLLASEIMEYGNVMANAVAQLRLRGVKESALCFDSPSWGGADYDHAGCADSINKIFDIAGAGMTWTQPPADSMDSAAVPDNLWHIYSDNEVDLIGTTCGDASCADLILVVDELSAAVCTRINDLLGIANPLGLAPTDSDMGTQRYTGAFGYTETIGDEAGGAPFQGQSSACFHKTTAPEKYVYYKVLLAR
ncbi:MAG: hypothetical protein K9G62_08460 [Alphaproteobacteria bacterium]|nr:hypothetical protein [Alphaproteobacteria bacterium]